MRQAVSARPRTIHHLGLVLQPLHSLSTNPPSTQVSTPPPPALLLHTPTHPPLITIPSLPLLHHPPTQSIDTTPAMHPALHAIRMHLDSTHPLASLHSISHPLPSILSPHSCIHAPTLSHQAPLISLASPPSYHPFKPSHPHQPYIHTYLPPMSCPHISLPDITALPPACRVKQSPAPSLISSCAHASLMSNALSNLTSPPPHLHPSPSRLLT